MNARHEKTEAKNEEAAKKNNAAEQEEKQIEEDLHTEIKKVQEEAKKHQEKLLRVLAEFENFKRRVTKEQEEQNRYANEKLLEALLPTLDDFDRVLNHIPESSSEEVKSLSQGVEMIRKGLAKSLERFQLKEIDAEEKPFDPDQHEAISMIESDEHDPNTVVAVHRKGYFLGERLLRPAMVSVAKKGDS